VTNEEVGAWVKNRRTARKLAVADLAAAAGISRPTWYSVEKADHPPSVETQVGVARAFQIGVDWYDRLIAGQEPVEIDAPPGGEPVVAGLSAGGEVSQPDAAGMESRLLAEIAKVDARAQGVERSMSAQLERMVARLEEMADQVERVRRES
jgi:DNA-binding XRE family transcriptional regulator